MANIKTLLVMRHAKSSWAYAGMPDHDRPLNKRGERDARQMGQFLVEQGVQIDRIAASTANRAQKTAATLIATIDGIQATQLEHRADFYLAPPRIYLNYLQTLDKESISTVMVIGHNPGLESLVHQLGHEWETMPTAAIACFECTAAKWSESSPKTWRLDHLWRPKEVLAHYRSA